MSHFISGMMKGQALELRNQLLFRRILASTRVCMALSSQASVQTERTLHPKLAIVSIMTAVLRKCDLENMWKMDETTQASSLIQQSKFSPQAFHETP